jgi:AraC-like DNA-binding protein
MSFAQWRQQEGLIHAPESLAWDDAMASASDALSYAAPGNFIAVFRRAFGKSLARYFACYSVSRRALEAAGTLAP